MIPVAVAQWIDSGNSPHISSLRICAKADGIREYAWDGALAERGITVATSLSTGEYNGSPGVRRSRPADATRTR